MKRHLISQNPQRNGTIAPWRWGLFLSLVALLALPATAQDFDDDFEDEEDDRSEFVREPISITPDRLIVRGTRGAAETRNLLLQTRGDLENLQVVPLALETWGGEATFPDAAILAGEPETKINADSILTLPLTFDFDRISSSGEYNGQLLLTYDNGQQTLPLTVQLKDSPLVPLIVLLTGVGLGVGLSTYRAQGKPRDRVLVRMGQLHAQMSADPKLARATSFQAQIDAHLLDMEMALQGEQWDVAGEAIDRAEAIWVTWRRHREDWIAQIDYGERLMQRIQEEGNLSPERSYLQSVCRRINRAIQDAPNGPPQALQQQLDECGEYLNRYLLLEEDLKHLNGLCARIVPGESEEPWRVETQNLALQLNTMVPNDGETYQTLSKDLKTAISKLEPLTSGGNREMVLSIPRLVFAPPSVHPATETPTSKAPVQLKIFSLTSYAIATILLSGLGFIQLYVKQPTFGANLWSDYLTLLAWGFGAEVTRESVTKVVRDWGRSNSNS
ncbi:hypothetical protein IQ235_11235 [Oscillatoriales cyanobacterium LEGE 11467]|uniref:Uncharacterized protein n=1 Tax=Zarconia navalis LEGE 11467 TaxID=1828826 RepID=A0A928VXD9_9CYAN|nr:hypothetical protein [Zarconia navalis]MBE9041354.1 hypothetical protein [Zarconia navalis LEGE 11467]